MAKPFLKPGKIVVMLNGRFAGHKAVIVKSMDGTNGHRKYGHCIVAGIDKAPQKILKCMTKRQIMRRSTIKPFVKVVNWNHIMPTRYSFDLATLPKVLDSEKLDAGKRVGGKVKKQVQNIFQTRFRAGKNKWFFSRLRF